VKEFAIIGGGIGGCSAAALLHADGRDVVLLEKEPYLGGCASTFTHRGYRYNSGATTLSGYGEGRVVRKLFDQVGVTPALIETDPSIVVVHNGKTTPRYRDIDRFVETINRNYPHPKHAQFWDLILTLSREFYALEGYHYSNQNTLKKLRSLMSFSPLIQKFWNHLTKDGRSVIEQFYGGISREYLDFLDAQILIVAQTQSDSVNFLTAALALGYTFEANHYAIGGMGKVCESLVSNIPDVQLSNEVLGVQKYDDKYRITTSKGVIEARNVILGHSIFESKERFADQKVISYLERYRRFDHHQSAFVLYMSIPTPSAFAHHYQLIRDAHLPHTISQSLFVSLSDPSDHEIAPQGVTSITASIHTDTRMWEGLSHNEYSSRKAVLQSLIEGWICDTLHIDKSAVLQSFAATPKTFGRYIGRTRLGGIPMKRTHLLPLLPSNDTPIEGFYHVGDTTYAAQGWPGVVMGSFNLMRLLDE
jgi:phytoene dehydrogenase-like protein